MLFFIIAVFFVGSMLFVGVADAYVRVRGYFRGGTYVQPHYRSDPDSFKWNNYSTWGNINPFDGRRGYKRY